VIELEEENRAIGGRIMKRKEKKTEANSISTDILILEDITYKEFS